jgi:hypothetical protein
MKPSILLFVALGFAGVRAAPVLALPQNGCDDKLAIHDCALGITHAALVGVDSERDERDKKNQRDRRWYHCLTPAKIARRLDVRRDRHWKKEAEQLTSTQLTDHASSSPQWTSPVTHRHGVSLQAVQPIHHEEPEIDVLPWLVDTTPPPSPDVGLGRLGPAGSRCRPGAGLGPLGVGYIKCWPRWFRSRRALTPVPRVPIPSRV